MAQKVGAVLLDTRGIQKYVFSSNKLKTNIGASYLVDHVFHDLMDTVLAEQNLRMPEQPWDKVGDLVMLTDPEIECETAYIGGGNMLLLVRKNEEEVLEICRNIVKNWTEKLLLFTPGLRTGAAVGYVDLDKEKYQESIDALYRQLKENQNRILPQVDLPYTGLTLECDYSGKTADVRSRVAGNRMVAAEIDAKLRAAEYSDGHLRELFSEELGQGGVSYQFISMLEDIGCVEGEQYISVIHIDGNNMGVKFSGCSDIKERKDLSCKVGAAVLNAFKKLVRSIIEEYPYDETYINNKKLHAGSDRRFLPIRPILIGGDDVTFICPGRLGLLYANRFIQFANEEEILDPEQQVRFCKKAGGEDPGTEIVIGRSFSCCAGVAITPVSYPFFRAYNLAEQLCSAAKRKSRKDDGSWLDYAILHGESYSGLETLRRYQYTGAKGRDGKLRNLHYGPYRVDGPSGEPKKLERLFRLKTSLLKEEENSVNKIKGLREVLFKDDHSISLFLENDDKLAGLLQRENGVDRLSEVNAGLLWEAGDEGETTRYLDAIEIIEFMIPDAKEGLK